MKIALVSFLISGFIGIAVFGAFAMAHGFGMWHSGCIAAASQGVGCPDSEGIIAFLAFHLGSFRSFSTASLGDNIINTLLIVLLFAVAVYAAVIVHHFYPAFSDNYHRRQFLELYHFPFHQKLTHWIAIHENSPATS